MYGKWWVEYQEKRAVEAKLEAFIASLDADERCYLAVILRERAMEEERQIDRQRAHLEMAARMSHAQNVFQQSQRPISHTFHEPGSASLFGSIWPRF